MPADPTMGDRAHDEAFATAIRSDELANLRQILKVMVAFKNVVGAIAEFHVVIDTNVLLFEVFWLLEKRRKTDARTALQENVAAGTIIAYATPQIMAEVERKLPILAAERGLLPDVCVATWTKYKAILLVRDADTALTARYEGGRDPSDASSLALAEGIRALGILTRDKDIKGMGGTAVPFEFILEARDYSRKAAVSVSIRVGGCYVALGAVAAAHASVQAARAMVGWFRGLPDAVKLIALVGLAIAIIHPKSRGAIVAATKNAGAKVSEALPPIFDLVAEIVELETRNQASPPVIAA